MMWHLENTASAVEWGLRVPPTQFFYTYDNVPGDGALLTSCSSSEIVTEIEALEVAGLQPFW